MAKKTDVSFHRLADLSARVVGKGIAQQIINGSDVTLSLLTMKAGAFVARHSHPNEQLTYILQGALVFHVGEGLEQEITVRAGEVLHIPANIPHCARALEDTLDLDVFSPQRTDWSNPGGEDYFNDR